MGVPAGIGAVLSPQGMNGFAALVLLSGALELVFWKDDASKSVDSIGDYGNPFQLGIGSPPFDPSKQLGVTAPLGFFDPLGFCKVGDEEGFRKLRIAELKHGRVAMMAAVGAVWQPVFPFPGFEKVPAGIGAVLSPQGMNGFAALVLLSGAL